MLQIVKREFEKLDELVRYTNNISIMYSYLNDYQIIKEDNKYNLLLNFDVPECKQLLELAKLKQKLSKDGSMYNTIYGIELEDKSKKIHSNIYFSNLRHGFKIQANFGYDGMFDLIEVEYKSLNDYFIIELRKFEYDGKTIGWHTCVDDTMLVKNIDYKIIYDHLIKLIFSRGYVLDFASLDKLEYNLCCIGQWLNKKDFNN